MKTIRILSDKFAIGLSLLCTVHCLLLPLILVALPSLAAMNLDDERFHLWMLLAVIPTSLLALTLGCKQHQRYGLFVLGSIGLVLLTLAVFGEQFVNPTGEKILTLAGTIFVALGHIWNYRLCKQQSPSACPCPEESDDHQ